MEKKDSARMSIEENLLLQIQPLVKQKVMGIRSYSEFINSAVREKLERYHELGIHPRSRYRKNMGMPIKTRSVSRRKPNRKT